MLHPAAFVKNKRGAGQTPLATTFGVFAVPPACFDVGCYDPFAEQTSCQETACFIIFAVNIILAGNFDKIRKSDLQQS